MELRFQTPLPFRAAAPALSYSTHSARSCSSMPASLAARPRHVCLSVLPSLRRGTSASLCASSSEQLLESSCGGWPRSGATRAATRARSKCGAGVDAAAVVGLLERLQGRFPKAHVLLTSDEASTSAHDEVLGSESEIEWHDVEIVQDELGAAGALADTLHEEIRFIARDADGNRRDPLDSYTPEALCKAVLGGHALRVSALASLGVLCIVCRGCRPPSPTTSCPQAVATASLRVCVPVRV